MNAHHATTVDNIRDWAVAVATVVAVWSSFWAIWQSKKQAKQSADDALRGRRIDHDLAILRELTAVIVNGLGNPPHAYALIKMTSSDVELPVTRHLFDLAARHESRLLAHGAFLVKREDQAVDSHLNIDLVTGEARAEILSEIADAATKLVAQQKAPK